MNTKSILLIGCGNMGKAMVQAFLMNEAIDCVIHIVEPNLPTADLFPEHAQKVTYYQTHQELPEILSPDYVIFAIKPQLFNDIVPQYKIYQKALFLSILAGTQIKSFESILGADVKIVRFMPNLPMMLGKGALAGYLNKNCTSLDKTNLTTLFEKAGLLAWLDDESQFDVVTALSGSGPAYIFALAESMISAGVQLGLSHDLSEQLTKQTILGSACLLTESDKDPATLRQNVTSPKGTTEAGLSVLCKPESGLGNLLLETLMAAKNRSIELSKN